VLGAYLLLFVTFAAADVLLLARELVLLVLVMVRQVIMVYENVGLTQGAAPARGTADPIRGRVLVVEDNPLNQLVAEGTLTGMGYEVHSVANGAEALDALALIGFSAVLMDCHMPVMDGFAATAEIRRREAGGARTPIIAMTAAALVEDRRRCLEAGMDDYVSKPVDPVTLQAVLDRWVRGPGAGGRAEGTGSAEVSGRGRVPGGTEVSPVVDARRLADLSELQTSRAEGRVGHRGRPAGGCPLRELELTGTAGTPTLRGDLLDELEVELLDAASPLTDFVSAHP